VSIVSSDRRPLFADFCRFSRAQLISGDIDPSYPVLARVYDAEGATTNDRLWRTLLYVGWYSLASAEAVRAIYPSPAPVDPARLPILSTGIERRGFRGDGGRARAASFLNGALARTPQGGGDLVAWVLGRVANRSPEEGWKAVREELELTPGAGPWASYKWADLLKNVHGIPIDAPDIGSKLGETAGPIPGMVKLTGLPWQEVAGTPSLQRALLAEARAAGVPFGGLDQLETSLCDFNSLCRGNYYLGKDLDEQQATLARDGLGGVWWAARAASFPAHYRGEVMGWTGVRSSLNTAYRDTGRLVGL
jgi:hypothetical protein